MKIGLFNKDVIFNQMNEFSGFNIGYDYAAEHESGIGGIRDAFGITQQKKNAFMRIATRLLDIKPVFGIKGRTATKIPEGIVYTEGEYYSIGYSTDFVNMASYIKDTENKLAWPGRKENFIGRWDENGFVLSTKDKAHFDRLKKAFEEKDIAFYLGSKGFLSAGGLHIIIPSVLDPEIDFVMTAMDEDNYNLGRMADDTCIEADLLAAGKKFHALNPGWKNEEKTEVWFWLNSVDRKSSGWYTVEELRLWIKNEGPIVEKKETTNK